MAARKASKGNPKYKTKHQVKNWPEYEAGLRARGDLRIWFDDDAIANWTAAPTGKRGAQPKYSDTAILAVLTLSLVFDQPLRQTEGLVAALLELMNLDLEVPDHTTVSRRRKQVEVPRMRSKSSGPLHLIMDSSRLKIYGAGEWRAHKHKGQKRRKWRGLHLGVDEQGHIVASLLTDGHADDAKTGVQLIQQVDRPIGRSTADGVYDRSEIYQALEEAGTQDVEVVIPPRSDAVVSESEIATWSQRNAAVELIERVGLRGWERESGYREQGRVENTFYRFKQILGDRLRSRRFASQSTEALLGCEVLNRMFELGRPESVAIAA